MQIERPVVGGDGGVVILTGVFRSPQIDIISKEIRPECQRFLKVLHSLIGVAADQLDAAPGLIQFSLLSRQAQCQLGGSQGLVKVFLTGGLHLAGQRFSKGSKCDGAALIQAQGLFSMAAGRIKAAHLIVGLGKAGQRSGFLGVGYTGLNRSLAGSQ